MKSSLSLTIKRLYTNLMFHIAGLAWRGDPQSPCTVTVTNIHQTNSKHWRSVVGGPQGNIVIFMRAGS